MKKKGFTLIELIAAMAITIIVFCMLQTILSGGLKVYGNGVNEVDMQDNVRRSLMNITNDIRKAKTAASSGALIDNINVDPSDTKLIYIDSINAAQPKVLYYIKTLSDGKKELYRTTLKVYSTTESTKWCNDDSIPEKDWALVDDISNFIKGFLGVLEESDIKYQEDISLSSDLSMRYWYKYDGINYAVVKDIKNGYTYNVKLVQTPRTNTIYEKDKDIKLSSKLDDFIIDQKGNCINITAKYTANGKQNIFQTSVTLRDYGGI